MRIQVLLKLAGVAVAAVGGLVFSALWAVSVDGAQVTQAQRASQEVAREIASLLNLTQEYTSYGGARPATQWHARHRELVETLAKIVVTSPRQLRELEALQSQAAALGEIFARYERVLGSPLDKQDAVRKALLQERLLVESQELVEARYAWAQQVISQDVTQQRTLQQTVLAGTTSMLALTLLAGWALHRRVLVPLNDLERATEGMSRGEMGARPVMSTDDEIGAAGRAVYAMADELKATQDRLKLIIDSVPALISQIGLDRRYTLVNKAYVEWDGRGLPDLVGHSVEEVHGAEGYALLKSKLDEAFGGHPVTFEVELRRGGAYHAVSVAYVPSYGLDGHVNGVYALKTDVTSVRRAEERLRLVMQSSPLGMFTTDIEGRCTYSNPALHRITGLTLEGSLGFGLREGVHPDDMHQIVTIRAAALSSPLPQTSEHRFIRPDGTVAWVRANVTSLWRDGAPEMIMGTMENITAYRALNMQLLEKSKALTRSNEDLERFAYVASHDLQEPLRMVNSYGQLLLRRHGEALNAEAKEFLAFMVDGGHRAQALVRDLLNLARLDSQSKPFAPVSLDAALGSSVHALGEELRHTKGKVTHDELPTVAADNSSLVQVFTNLIGNALKFKSDAAPLIHVSAWREGAGWTVSVKDNGMGIEPRFFERIFVMFQRLHLRSEHPGTGIGLAICKRVVERHGGRIWVEPGPRPGTEFRFTLPDVPGGTAEPEQQGGVLARVLPESRTQPIVLGLPASSKATG